MPGLAEALVRVALAARLLLVELFRRRGTFLTLLALPLLFHAVALATAPHDKASVVLPALAEPGLAPDDDEPSLRDNPFVEQLVDDGRRSLPEDSVALVFLGAAAVGFTGALVGFYLVHGRADADRRLIASGYRWSELYAAKLLTVGLLLSVVAGLQTLLLLRAFAVRTPLAVLAAYIALGLTYGGFGLLLGAVSRGELAGIAAIVLLTNLDVGWLQNPAYYAASRSKWLIRGLPAHHATQLALTGAFEASAPTAAVRQAAVVAIGLLAAAGVAYRFRTRSFAAIARGPTRASMLGILLVSYAVWYLLYQVIGTFAASLPARDLSTSLDRAIPLVPWAVWVYQSCYFLPFVPLVITRDPSRLKVALLAALIASGGAFLMYVLVPVAFPRPELGSSLSERWLSLEYAFEFVPGANNMPSLHVTMSWLVWLACRPYLGRAARIALLSLVVAISISTLLVKQHIVVDVLSGTIWAFAAFELARRIGTRWATPARPENSK